MNRTLAAAIALPLALGACTTQQIQTAQDYQARIAGACGVLMTMAPFSGAMAPWVVTACGTEAAIARIALDPSTLVWLNDLAAKIRALRA
jgi:hypothetical protein